MVQVKEGDFVLLDFTGKVDGKVFETTREKDAKESGLPSVPKFGPALVVVGKGQVLKGLDRALVGTEAGSEKSVKIASQDGYGDRSAELVRLIPLQNFRKQGVNPYPGMPLDLDEGVHATVIGVESGRVRVDLNHPLAGKDLEYSFKVIKVCESGEDRVKTVSEQLLGENASAATFKDGTARLGVGENVAKASQEFLSAKLRSIQLLLQYAPEVKKVVFEEEYAMPQEAKS